MIGLSAGARSKLAFHWVCNLLSRKHSQYTIDDFNQKQCSAFTFLWNWLWCNLHKEILDNFDEWMNTTMIPCMTPEWQELSKKGSYTIELEGQDPMTFNNIELAPPAGMMVSNYVR